MTLVSLLSPARFPTNSSTLKGLVGAGPGAGTPKAAASLRRLLLPPLTLGSSDLPALALGGGGASFCTRRPAAAAARSSTGLSGWWSMAWKNEIITNANIAMATSLKVDFCFLGLYGFGGSPLLSIMAKR